MCAERSILVIKKSTSEKWRVGIERGLLGMPKGTWWYEKGDF
jgi:hypothetical protein